MPAPPSHLAPLQRVMLRDSLVAPTAGHHAEQLELVFTPEVSAQRVATAWQATVAQTAALQIAFTEENGVPCGWELAVPSAGFDRTVAAPSSSAALDSWLAADRVRPLLAAGEVPWRAIFWPEQRRLIWTFHHALLDGRSIDRVLRSFLQRVKGGHQEILGLSRWLPPTPAAVALAARWFAELVPQSSTIPAAESVTTAAVQCMGAAFAQRLERVAAANASTVAAVLTWSWGQVILAAAGSEVVWIEQLRAGIPQPATAGFTMNLLPVMIRATTRLAEFRAHLLAMRAIETISAVDFPVGGFPDMRGPWASVIMVERGTLRPPAAASEWVEILKLHERKGTSLAATAHVLPDLRLEVEGPSRHALLASWIEILDQLGS